MEQLLLDVVLTGPQLHLGARSAQRFVLAPGPGRMLVVAGVSQRSLGGKQARSCRR